MPLDLYVVHYIPKDQYIEGMVCLSPCPDVLYIAFRTFFLCSFQLNLSYDSVMGFRWIDVIMIALLVTLSISLIFLVLLLLFHR